MSKLIKRKSNFADWPRRKIRYWLFRLRTEVTGGASSNGVPHGFKEFFERLEGFKDWRGFAVSWDIPHINGEARCDRDPCKCASELVDLRIVARQFSVWEEWQATVRSEATVFPGLEKHEKRLEE
jgi:hypothetical protein